MKLISKCERRFVSNCIIKRQKRVDGRELSEGRTLDIVFGKERGCCMVLQGNSRVLVQVNCEISEPKTFTPSEGIIHVNLEFSAMASPDAKSYSRTSDEFVEAQRSIERCIRDSKCIDLESLCIVTGSKVWTIRVDIHALNDDGNLIECASIATISALAHFRRPEVTVVGTEVTVHSIEEKEPVALNVRHMPISVNLAVFDEGNFILVDPNEIEENVCDGCYVIGMNAHQEICFAHRRGVFTLREESIRKCEEIAVKRSQEVTQIIRSALDDDAYKRVTKASIGFTKLIQTQTVLGTKCQAPELSEIFRMLQKGVKVMKKSDIDDNQLENSDSENRNSQGENRIGDSSQMRSGAKERALHILQESENAVFEGGQSKWGSDIEDESFEDEDEASETQPDVSAVKERLSSSDSEEETVFINKEQLDMKPSKTRGWFSKDPFS